MAEIAQQNLIRQYWTDIMGGRLDRNNVGCLPDRRGVPVRFGLANDSEKVNAICKSGDLIGYTPTLVTLDMVGTFLPVFTSVEVKKRDWSPARSGDRFDHEQAQRNWAQIVRAAGGLAGFMRDPTEGFIYE